MVVFIIYQHCCTKSEKSESTIGRFYVRNKEFYLRKAAQYDDSQLFMPANWHCPIKEGFSVETKSLF